MKRRSIVLLMVIFGLVIGLTLSSGLYAQDSSGGGVIWWWEQQNNDQNNNQGNSNQNQNTQPVRQPQLVGYTIVVRGPVASSGNSTRYGTQTYTVRIRNRNNAIAEARNRFRSAYHLRPDTGLTIMSIDEIYE